MKRLHYLSILLLLLSGNFWLVLPGLAQVDILWEPMNEGLEGDQVDVLWRSPTGTFFAGGIGGLFRSAEIGARWAATKLSDHSVAIITADSMGSLLAGTDQGLFLSNDDGSTWHSTEFTLPINDIAVGKDGELALATADGVYHRQNETAPWIRVGQWTLGVSESGLIDLPVNSVALLQGGELFAAHDFCVYRSGKDRIWECVIPGQLDTVMKLYAETDTTLIVAGFSGLYRYHDVSRQVRSLSFYGTAYDIYQTEHSLYIATFPTFSSGGPSPGGIYRFSLADSTWRFLGLDGKGNRALTVSEDEGWICVGLDIGILSLLDTFPG